MSSPFQATRSGGFAWVMWPVEMLLIPSGRLRRTSHSLEATPAGSKRGSRDPGFWSNPPPRYRGSATRPNAKTKNQSTSPPRDLKPGVTSKSTAIEATATIAGSVSRR